MADITYGALAQMQPRTAAERMRAAALARSVMTRDSEQWQPEYQREPGLESPMISPEDLLLMGGPSALKAVGSALRNARLLGGKSGAIPIREFERNVANFKPREGERVLYHATDIPWEGNSPRPGTWFTTEPPRSENPFGNTVRAYSVPEKMLSGAKLPRGKGFQNSLTAGSEPIVAVDEGGGLTSYVVRDPSVLKRMEVKRSLSPTPVSGSPRSQRGALGDLWYSMKFPEASREQMDALDLYTRSPEIFKPQSDRLEDLIPMMVEAGELTRGQAENLSGIRSALNDLLKNEMDLPGSIYRGLTLPKKGMPRLMDVVGGKGGPASFSFDPLQAELFTEPKPDQLRALIEAYQDVGNKVQGIVLPRGFGAASRESEVLLHPSTNIVIERKFYTPDEEFGNLYNLEGFLDRGLTPDKTVFKRGGLVHYCNCMKGR